MAFLPSLPKVMPSSIERIEITIFAATFEEIFDERNHPSFRALDMALHDSKLTALRYFIYHTVAPEDNSDGVHERVRSTFQAIMPTSYESGILWWGDDDDTEFAGRGFMCLGT